MRVIPIEWIEKYIELNGGEEIREMLECYEDSSTSVEAIPIEWLLRKYCNKGIVRTEKYMMRSAYLKEIIRDWERES